jgi:hypothetical protein
MDLDALRRGEFLHQAMQLARLGAVGWDVVIERQDDAVGMADRRSTHLPEIIERHRRRAVSAKRAIDLTDDEIAGASIGPRLCRQDLFADRFTSHGSVSTSPYGMEVSLVLRADSANRPGAHRGPAARSPSSRSGRRTRAKVTRCDAARSVRYSRSSKLGYYSSKVGRESRTLRARSWRV